MKEIAKEYQVEWDTTESEMELLKPPEELTMSSSLSLPAPSCVKIKFYYPVLILTLFDQEGPKTFVSATSIPIKPMPKKSVEPTNPSTTRYSDIGERNSMNFEDTSSVVEAATESAKKAIAAAGTAAYLANRDSYQPQTQSLQASACARLQLMYSYSSSWIFYQRRLQFLGLVVRYAEQFFCVFNTEQAAKPQSPQLSLISVRAIVFGFHIQVFNLHPRVLVLGILDLPGLLFFSTYTLLVLFWAEIYHQARSLPTDKLRIVFVSVNGVVYIIQACIWVYIWIDDNSIAEFIGKIFIAVVSFVAALGFLIYGGRLFFMLRRFPIESKGRRKKLHEVGSVTAICFSCFLVRCFVEVLSALDSDASLDVLDHPVLNLIYYMLVEILPSALVLYILRKLPPKRISAQYHPIR